MAKRTTRTQTPKPDESGTETNATVAEAARPKTKRSQMMTPDELVETADDSAATQGSTPETPSEDDIRHRAYQRYLQRGGGHGLDFDDWLEAERELKKL